MTHKKLLLLNFKPTQNLQDGWHKTFTNNRATWHVTIFWHIFSCALSSELTIALFSKPQWLATSQDIPSYDEICQKTYIWFGFYPCLWQIQVVEAILKHDKDIISIAATGAGKSLTFWMPLLFNKGGIQVVVTPLNILGDQNINDLKARGVSG